MNVWRAERRNKLESWDKDIQAEKKTNLALLCNNDRRLNKKFQNEIKKV